MTAPGTPNTLNYQTHAAEAYADLVGKTSSTTLKYQTHSGEVYATATSPLALTEFKLMLLGVS